MSELSNALSMLEVMNGPNWEAQEEIYCAALSQIPEHLLCPSVSKLAGEKWRPAPFDLLREAAKLEMAHRAGTRYPFPSADEAYAEIVGKVREFGLNGRPLPERPSILTPGPPPFSHPLVARTVALIGGWEGICTGEANYAEGLAKQVKAVYERQAEQWVDEGVRALCLPPEQNRRWFPRWEPWQIAAEWEEPCRMRLPRAPRPQLVRCPPTLLRQLRAAGVEIDGDDAPERERSSALVRSVDPEKLRAVRQELAERRARESS